MNKVEEKTFETKTKINLVVKNTINENPSKKIKRVLPVSRKTIICII